MKKYHKIRQVKDTVKGMILQYQFRGLDDEERPIYDKTAELPRIELSGTTKIHGTNASINYDTDTNELTAYSRTQRVSGEGGHSHSGFVQFVNSNSVWWKETMAQFCNSRGISEITVYMEWAGNGIKKKKKVGVSRLAKFAYVFDVFDHDNDKWLDSSEAVTHFSCHDIRVWNTSEFPQFNMEIDLAYPAITMPFLDKLTDDVEKSCPVGKVIGEFDGKDMSVDNIGEGIVWRYEDVLFKVKGEKHSIGRGAKKSASMDPIKAQSIKDFVDQVVTEDRLEQAMDVCKITKGGIDVVMRDLGTLMKWIFADIMDEEGDALEANNLNKKDVGGAIANKARPWFQTEINKF